MKKHNPYFFALELIKQEPRNVAEIMQLVVVEEDRATRILRGLQRQKLVRQVENNIYVSTHVDYPEPFSTVENWMNDLKKLCPECWLPSDSIKFRIDPYELELKGKEELMVSCHGCYHQRYLEI